MLISQLIPQRVELVIMLAPLVVRELMQHSINNLLQRQEQISIIMIPQADTNLVSAINIQAEQVPFRWQEFCQDLDAPASFAHDGLNGRGDSAEKSEGCIAAWEAGEVLVAVEEWFVFFELGGVVALDVGGSAFFGGSVAAGEGGSAVWGHVVHVVKPEICYARSEREPVAKSKLFSGIRSSRQRALNPDRSAEGRNDASRVCERAISPSQPGSRLFVREAKANSQLSAARQ